MPIPFANILQPLISVFEAILVFIHDHVVGGSWGLAIVGLTVAVRAVLLPLTLKQVKSMQSLQRLSPQIKGLQEKYKGDKQRLNQEMMKLYQEHKVNPFGSCLPLAAQLPVFFALFYMLRKELKLDICGPKHLSSQALATAQRAAADHHQSLSQYITHHNCGEIAPHSASFLFIPDITNKASGAVLAVLVVLYIASQLASSLLMTVTADRNQRLLMLGVPFIFTIFILRFPAGLLVYWITTNLWTIVQQYIVRRAGGPTPALPGAAAKTPDPPTRSRVASSAPARTVTAGATAGVGSGTSGPPPSSRKKKKRSGRRR